MMFGATGRRIAASTLLEGEDYRLARDRAIELDEGSIAGIEDAADTSNVFAIPALANAHDHARAVPSSAYGVYARPLEIWLQSLSLLPPVDPYLAAAVSLGRSAIGGSAAVMVHHTRPFGRDTTIPDEARAIARAARDVGVRVAFAVALKDRNPLVYGPHDTVLAALPVEARRVIETRLPAASPTPSEHIALVEEVADAAQGTGLDVQYGPTGAQWCTPALLEAVAEASEATGRRVHMHCLETIYQRDWADRAYQNGLLPALDAIGLLTPRLTLAHCTHARPEELALLAERGVTISVNAGSNLGLRSGIAPVREMVRQGCRIAMGLDGLALVAEDDALGEMRLNHALHGGLGFREDLPVSTCLRMAMRNGRRSVLGDDEGGTLQPGAPADILLLDRAALDPYDLPGGSDLHALLARGAKQYIQELIVGGRTIVQNGSLTGLDHKSLEAEMLSVFRSGLAKDDGLRPALAALELALADHYDADALGCC